MKVAIWLAANVAALAMSVWDLRDAWTVYRTAQNPPEYVKVTAEDRRAVSKNLQMTGLRALLAATFVAAGLVSVLLPAYSWTVAWLLVAGALILAATSYISFRHRRRQHAQLRRQRGTDDG